MTNTSNKSSIPWYEYPLGWVRPPIKLLLAMLWCLGCTVRMILFNCVGKFEKREADALRWTGVWARGLCWICGIKVKLHGETHQLGGGFVISNHQSYIDILVHGAIAPLKFAPKKEIRYWPIFGWVAETSLPVWIDRSSPIKAKESMLKMCDAVKRGCAMLVYAEGTTSDGKSGLLPFKSTGFEAAIESNYPIFPILTIYTCVPDRGHNIAWYGDDTLLPHAWKTLSLRQVNADVFILPPMAPLPGENRKKLAVRVHDTMEAQLKKLISEQ